MYQVRVKVLFEDGSREEKVFDFWGEAGTWLEYLAGEGDKMPKKVEIQIER